MASEVLQDEILYMDDGIPFHLKQPTEQMNEIFKVDEELLKKCLGDDIIGVYRIGSGAIPGMVGSAELDLVLCMKDFPPTKDQIKKLADINYQDMGNTPHSKNDIFFWKVGYPDKNDKRQFAAQGHLGRVNAHFTHYKNPWIRTALAFNEYLKVNEDAFNRYRDTKINGVKMVQTGDTDGERMFLKYKKGKKQIVLELQGEANKWAYEDGNYAVPKEIDV